MMDSDVRILHDSDVDITKSRWGDLTFYSRFRHFFKLTDPTNCLKSNKKLDEAQDIVKQYKYVLYCCYTLLLYLMFTNPVKPPLTDYGVLFFYIKSSI